MWDDQLEANNSHDSKLGGTTGTRLIMSFGTVLGLRRGRALSATLVVGGHTKVLQVVRCVL